MTSAREQQLTTDDGVALFVTDYAPASGAALAGSILLMHGLGEHLGAV